MNVSTNDSGQTPLVTAGEVASHALRIIHSSLRIEEDWTVRRGRGFTWWPGRLTHQVDAGPQVRDGGLALMRMRSRIPVLAEVLAPRHAVENALAEWNRHADSYCYVYDPEHCSVDSVQSAFTCHGVRDWHPRALALQFAMQLEHADAHADSMRRELLAQLASSRRSARSGRWARVSMLRLIDREVLPAGQGSSRFANKPEFDTILKEAHRGNAASLGTNETGMCIEVPFGTWTALIVLYAADPLPAIGHGLGVSVRLPICTTFDECARLAAWLNRKEADGDFFADGIGAWTVMKIGQRCWVAHHSFTPNALYRPGLAMRLAQQAARKVNLVNRLLNPGMPEPAVWDLIVKRLGLELPVEREGGEVRFALPN